MSGNKLDQDQINNQASNKKGFFKHLENVFRKFKDGATLLMLFPLIIIYIICIGVSVTPGIYLYQLTSTALVEQILILKCLGLGLSIGAGFILFILTLIFIVPVFNFPLIFLVRSYRGPWYAMETIPWYYHNALFYLVRYTILEFLTPSPLNILFFRMMGMKIGKHSVINTTNISDPCLITIGDYVTIGGSTFMMAHYGMKGYLIIDRLTIGDKTMIGLNAKILGGVRIGKKVIIGPNATVLPKTILKDEEKFGV